MIALDTNMLVRWLAADWIADGEGRRQAERVAHFMAENEAPIFINHIVIVEVVWMLRQKVRLARTAVADFVQKLIAHPRIIVQDRAVVVASLLSYSCQPGDFADHLIGEINSRNGCSTTYTFDRAAARSPLFSELSR